MDILKYIGYIGLIGALFVSCNDYDSAYTDVSTTADETVFNGSMLEYLEQGDPELGVAFDSLLFIINNIPGLRDSLAQTNSPKTIFAVPNSCFQEAMLRLNNYRAEKERGSPLSLSDFMIEPFVVIEEQPGPTPDSTIIIEHHYDYRLQLDSLVSRYVLEGDVSTGNLLDYPDGLDSRDFKFSYLMHVLFQRQFASGIENMGQRRLIFSDKNGTQLAEVWDRSETQAIDIRTNNGYVHVLADGHEFGFSKLIANFQNYGNEYIYD